MKVNQNNIIAENLKPNVMYVDMNCFFPSCEQQVNYWLRGRPVGVCVYTSKHGSVIALSKEAKKKGIKPARLSEIMVKHPEFVPIETNPNRYCEFHVKIMNVLRQFCDDVVPKSIDEAVLNFSTYSMVYKDLEQVARDIKKAINREVGDWLTCSIGIAPNAFLAKLGSDIQKPDGLTIITPNTIDSILSKLSLTDFPGISKNMAARLMLGGIHSPLQMRHSTPAHLRRACKSIVGEHWYYRLNFKEVDIAADEYKSMQAMRQISKEQRTSSETLHYILRALCIQLEKRMVKYELAAGMFGFSCNYEDGTGWSDHAHTTIPVQGGIELMNMILTRMRQFEKDNDCGAIINCEVTRMTVWVTHFADTELVQYTLFESNVRTDRLRKAVYDLKDKFGFEKIQHAAELTETPIFKDVIGFGSIKDLLVKTEKKKPETQKAKPEMVYVYDNLDFDIPVNNNL